ncbi:hypothetical protein HQ590_12125, partial [bacterium]|nr:hypothetical protein [bacterium]
MAIFPRKHLLRDLATTLSRRPWWFVLGGVLAAVVAAVYTAHCLQFRTSRNDLIGRDSEYWRLYSEYAQEFRAEEDYILLVESDQPSRNREAVDALVAALLDPADNPHPADPADAQSFTAGDLFYR